MAMEDTISWALSLLAALFVGGFAKSYMVRKGENLATHEDIEKLVQQVQAVTRATEDIKASISTEAWTRQLRKEACYEMLRQLPKMNEAMLGLVRSCSRSSNDVTADVQFVSAYNSYLESEVILSAVCGSALQAARVTLTGAIIKLNDGAGRQDATAADTLFANWVEMCNAFTKACRKELQIGGADN
jgi:hypothetical protein